MKPIQCPGCKTFTPGTRQICLKCGAPLPVQVPDLPSKPSFALKQILILLLLAVGIGLFSRFSGQEKPSEPSAGTNAVGAVGQGGGSGIPLAISSDAGAQYFVLEAGGSPDYPTLITVRVGPSGNSYAKRLFDCRAATWKYLGDGETLEAMNRSQPDAYMARLVDESIAWYQWRYACSEFRQKNF